MAQPTLERVEYDLLDIDDDDYLSLMDINGEQKEDLRIPSNALGKEIQKKFDLGVELSVTVLTWGTEEAVISYKNILIK